MTTNPEEHDFIKQVCAEDDAARVPPRLSDDPVVRLAECRGEPNCMGDAYVGAREDVAIWKKRALEAEEKVRVYGERVVDLGVLGMRAAVAKPTFDEAAERVKFEALCESKGLEYDRYTEYAGEYAGQYTISRREHEWHGWFACAKSRAEGSV